MKRHISCKIPLPTSFFAFSLKTTFFSFWYLAKKTASIVWRRKKWFWFDDDAASRLVKRAFLLARRNAHKPAAAATLHGSFNLAIQTRQRNCEASFRSWNAFPAASFEASGGGYRRAQKENSCECARPLFEMLITAVTKVVMFGACTSEGTATSRLVRWLSPLRSSQRQIASAFVRYGRKQRVERCPRFTKTYSFVRSALANSVAQRLRHASSQVNW